MKRPFLWKTIVEVDKETLDVISLSVLISHAHGDIISRGSVVRQVNFSTCLPVEHDVELPRVQIIAIATLGLNSREPGPRTLEILTEGGASLVMTTVIMGNKVNVNTYINILEKHKIN